VDSQEGEPESHLKAMKELQAQGNLEFIIEPEEKPNSSIGAKNMPNDKWINFGERFEYWSSLAIKE